MMRIDQLSALACFNDRGYRRLPNVERLLLRILHNGQRDDAGGWNAVGNFLDDDHYGRRLPYDDVRETAHYDHDHRNSLTVGGATRSSYKVQSGGAGAAGDRWLEVFSLLAAGLGKQFPDRPHLLSGAVVAVSDGRSANGGLLNKELG
jgi:hypothetical protein